jgi:hypothetical protein
MLSRRRARHYTRRAMPNNRRPRLESLFTASTALLLSACSQPGQYAPPCPVLRLLGDAADISSFDARGQDLTDLVVAGRITGVPASCQSGGRGKTAATMHVQMQVTRGPALRTGTAQLPYFVTIVDGGAVLEQRDYVLGVEFPANVDTFTVDGPEINMVFPVTPEKSAAAYTIYVGFRLTPQQLQYNRRGGG